MAEERDPEFDRFMKKLRLFEPKVVVKYVDGAYKIMLDPCIKITQSLEKAIYNIVYSYVYEDPEDLHTIRAIERDIEREIYSDDD